MTLRIKIYLKMLSWDCVVVPFDILRPKKEKTLYHFDAKRGAIVNALWLSEPIPGSFLVKIVDPLWFQDGQVVTLNRNDIERVEVIGPIYSQRAKCASCGAPLDGSKENCGYCGSSLTAMDQGV